MLDVMVATAAAWIVVGLVAAVALVATVALARAHGRRLERRMAAELGRRWDDHRPIPQVPITGVVVGSPIDTPTGPDAELRITLDELLEQRDALLEEFQDVQARIQIMKKEAERRRRVVPVRGGDETTADIIVLRDPVGDEERSERGR
jgi:hypothetical protein